MADRCCACCDAPDVLCVCVVMVCRVCVSVIACVRVGMCRSEVGAAPLLHSSAPRAVSMTAGFANTSQTNTALTAPHMVERGGRRAGKLETARY